MSEQMQHEDQQFTELFQGLASPTIDGGFTENVMHTLRRPFLIRRIILLLISVTGIVMVFGPLWQLTSTLTNVLLQTATSVTSISSFAQNPGLLTALLALAGTPILVRLLDE